MSESEDTRDWDELNEEYRKAREESLKQTLEGISSVLSIEDKLKRLEEISDEVWEEAEEKDKAEGTGEA